VSILSFSVSRLVYHKIPESGSNATLSKNHVHRNVPKAQSKLGMIRDKGLSLCLRWRQSLVADWQEVAAEVVPSRKASRAIIRNRYVRTARVIS
jgi:hypothetical protein